MCQGLCQPTDIKKLTTSIAKWLLTLLPIATTICTIRYRLQKLQNRALRTVYSDKDPQLDEQGLHAEADILLLKQRRVLHLLNLMFHRSKKDVYLDKRQMPTRQFDKIKFKVIAPQVKKAFRSPNYLGAQLWDALPLDTQTSPTFGLFKSRVIRHIAAGMFNG